MKFRVLKVVVPLALVVGGASHAYADKIKNPTAVFSGLDKITGRIVSFEVAVDETVQFGALQLTPKVCYTRPPTESPNTTSFAEVDEVTLENKYRRIFTGWMFAASPGLHGIEHPIYDIWLTDCKGGAEVVAEPKDTQDEAPVVASRPERQRRQPAEPRPPSGTEPPSSRTAQRAPAPPAQAPPSGRLDVAPLRGVPVQPRQEPSQRFFPTNAPGGGGGGFDGGPDPAGNNR